MQLAWCLSINEQNPTPAPSLGKDIGGYFGVQVYEYLLTPQALAQWERASIRYGEKASDIVLQTPEPLILAALPQIVPDPPTRVTIFDDHPQWQQQLAVWKAWIPQHREELRLLQPTGEGVDWSPKACKNGVPVKRRR